MIEIIAKASAANDRVPEDSTPGAVFTAIVILLMTLWVAGVWYVNYGPGAAKDADESP